MAPHLARSYHHLFPLEPYTETRNERGEDETTHSENKYIFE